MSLIFRIEDKEVRDTLDDLSGKGAYKEALHKISLLGAKLYRSKLPPGKLRKSVTSYYSGLSATIGSTSPIAHIIEFGHKAFIMKAPTKKNHKKVYVVNTDFKFTEARQPSVPGQYPLTRAFKELLDVTPSIFKNALENRIRRK